MGRFDQQRVTLCDRVRQRNVADAERSQVKSIEMVDNIEFDTIANPGFFEFAPDQPRGEPVSMSSSDPIAALEQRIVELEAAAHAADERARAVQASKDRQITELASKLNEITKTRDELADASESLRRALADAEARIAKLLGAALSPLSEPTTWAEALGACNADYVEACRRYPQLRLDLIRRANLGQ